MNQYEEMQSYLDDANRTMAATLNTLRLAHPSASDYDEILRECTHNIKYIKEDLRLVEEFLYPERFAVFH